MIELTDVVWNDEQQKTFGQILQAFGNHGICERDGQIGRIQIQDLLSVPDATRFIPAVVQTVVREALEPNLLVVPSVFQEVQLGAGRMIQIGAVGAIHAADIPEGQEYPERQPDLDGGDMTSIMVSKSGCMIRVTDEMISDSQFDIIGLWLRAAGRALARHKERKALKLLDGMGITVFDNNELSSSDDAAPNDSELGYTTGRGIDGKQNGSMSVDDIFEMYSFQLLRGFTPDALIMHPLAWKTFMSDPEMREIVLQGNTLVSNRLPNGGPAPAWGTSHEGRGLRTTATGAGIAYNRGIDQNVSPASLSNKIGANPWVSTLNPLGATFQIAPRYLPAPLTVLLSPFVPYHAATSVIPIGETSSIARPSCSVIMVDTSNTGLLVTRDPVSTEEFDDPARDIRALKIRERYGFGTLEQGKAVAIAKNVAIHRNYVFENTHTATLSRLQQTDANYRLVTTP